MHLPSRARPLGLAIVTALGCASTRPCPGGRACGSASWLVVGGASEGRLVLAPAIDVATAGGGPRLAAHEALPVGRQPVLLRFDLTPLVGAAGIERALLVLSPHVHWRVTGRAPQLLVRTALGRWSAASVAAGEAPPLSPAPAAEVTLPAQARAGVRVDVTAVVRDWLGGTLPAEGLALEAAGGTPVFTGAGALALAERPRLEVVLP